MDHIGWRDRFASRNSRETTTLGRRLGAAIGLDPRRRRQRQGMGDWLCNGMQNVHQSWRLRVSVGDGGKLTATFVSEPTHREL